jgi:hypothetical protein
MGSVNAHAAGRWSSSPARKTRSRGVRTFSEVAEGPQGPQPRRPGAQMVVLGRWGARIYECVLRFRLRERVSVQIVLWPLQR